MKRICLLRHAKSSWENRQLQDNERPLKPRGHRDCQLVGENLAQRNHDFGTVVSSTAIRAKQTIVAVLAAAGQADLEWQVDDDLYDFDGRRILRWIRNTNPAIDDITLVGHNPAFTDLCNDLAYEDLDNLPTCGFAELICDVKTWRDVTDGCAQLNFLLTPKMLKLRKSSPDRDWYRD